MDIFSSPFNNRLYLYELECSSQEEVLKHEDETSGMETLTRWSLGTIKKSNNSSYNTIYVNEELVLDKDYFLVVAKWSDNDDWNVHHFNKLKVLGIFNDEENAQRLANKIEEHYQKYLTTSYNEGVSLNERLNCEYKHDNKIVKIPTPWNGYFKVLEHVKVEKVKYDNGKKNKIKNRL